MTASERQQIPVLRALPAEAIRESKDAVEDIIAALDAALDAYKLLASRRKPYIQTRREGFVTLVVPELPHAEYTARLWASAHGAELREDESRYDDARWIGDSLYRHRIRSLRIVVDGFEIASVQFAPELLDHVEPHVVTGADAAWSPSQGQEKP